MSKYTEAQWTAAVSAALRSHDVQAVPGLLALMALDGYPNEAEYLRQMMLLLSAADTQDGGNGAERGDGDE